MRNGEETIYRSCLYTIPEGFCGNVNAQSDLQISITRVAVTAEYFADTREVDGVRRDIPERQFRVGYRKIHRVPLWE